MKVNEKDSAFISFALNEASCFELSVQMQDVFTTFDDCSCALARPAGGASNRA